MFKNMFYSSIPPLSVRCMIPRLDDWEAEKNPHCAIMQEDGTGEEWCLFSWRRRPLNAQLRGLYLSASEKPVVSDAFLRDVIQRSTANESCGKLDHWMTLDDLR